MTKVVPSLDSARAHYSGPKAEDYDATRHKKLKWRLEEECLATMLRGLSGKVIDVPVGTGRFLHLYDDLGLEAVGVDYNDAMLDRARAKHPDAQLRQGDVTKLPYPDGEFDIAVCIRLLHLISPPEVKMVMRELLRITKSHVIVSINVAPKARPVKRSQIHTIDTLLGALYPPWDAACDTTLLEQDGKLGSYQMWHLRR